MGVSVRQTGAGPDGAEPDPVYVEDGYDFAVRDGVLVVLDGPDGRPVAVFAAGRWVSAQVEDA